MSAHADTYDRIRQRVDALVRGLDTDALSTPVSACPGWSVADLTAHLAAIPADVAAGNLDGVGTDAYTARQIDERRGRAIGEVLDEWEEHAPTLSGAFDAFPFEVAAGPAIGDAHTHELDIRHALGAEIVVDDDALAVTITYYAGSLGTRVGAAGLPALRVVAGADEHVVGEGEPAATVTAPPLEMARALTGRRTLDEVRALVWNGDPEPYLEVFSQYSSTPTSLGESSV